MSTATDEVTSKPRISSLNAEMFAEILSGIRDHRTQYAESIRFGSGVTDRDAAEDHLAIFDTNFTTILATIASHHGGRELKPVAIEGANLHPVYVLVVHPSQISHLRHNRRYMHRVAGISAIVVPLWLNAVALDDGVLVCESLDIPHAKDDVGWIYSTRRAVLFGNEGLNNALAVTTFVGK